MTILTLTSAASRTSASGDGPDSRQWLEEVESPRALAWVHEHNARALAAVRDRAPFGDVERETRDVLLASDRIPMPNFRGEAVDNFWQDERAVRGIWRTTTLAGYAQENPPWETILDLDALAAREGENWVWAGADCLPEDPTRCLVSLSRGGKDAVVVREFDVATKSFIEGGFTLSEAKTRVTWWDADTLLVATEFGPDSLSPAGYPLEVRQWKRGEPLSQARRIYRGEPKDMSVHVWTLRDGDERHGLLLRMRSWLDMDAFELREDGTLRALSLPADIRLEDIYHGRLLTLLRSDWKVGDRTLLAGSAVAVPLSHPDQPELLLAPTASSAIDSIFRAGDAFYVESLVNVKSELQRGQLDAAGRLTLTPVDLPKGGTLRVFASARRQGHLLASYVDFLRPSEIFYLDPAGAPRSLRHAPARFDSSPYVSEQLFARSADGTRVPYFVVHSKNIVYNGQNPTWLTAYGGFELARVPYYLGATGRTWLDRGGVFVLANIRGGGEFGPAWHQQAIRENRVRVFEDFEAVAADLAQRQITSPAKLGISGGSNGGLLVGAVTMRHPELFGAVVCEVPLLDMLRYHLLLAGSSWMDEYGNPDDPAMREVLRSYSPYHNVRAGVRYPRILFMTSTKDDRVHPGHARKMAALLEEHGQDVLFYENTEGGHGGSANLEQMVLMESLEASFLWQTLGPPPEK
jgi:prolyl oligopeptidase